VQDQETRFSKELQDLQNVFRRQNAAAEYAGIPRGVTVPNPVKDMAPATTTTLNIAAPAAATVDRNNNMATNPTMTVLNMNQHHHHQITQPVVATAPTVHPTTTTTAVAATAVPPTFTVPVENAQPTDGVGNHNPDHGVNNAASVTNTSLDPPKFKTALHASLGKFWAKQLAQMQELPIGTEQDFKNHNDLPLARIKRIMKSDEDVRMISAEAPVLFAKACELFILELTLRSWAYSEGNKRRTLQKDDIQTAIRRTDIFDFLVDVIN